MTQLSKRTLMSGKLKLTQGADFQILRKDVQKPNDDRQEREYYFTGSCMENISDN